MLYYTEEARKSAIKNINELIVKVGKIPGNYLDYTSATEITRHLSDLIKVIEKENRKERK